MDSTNFAENNLNHKSGMVAVIGKPNVGKSTLINCIMKQKITISSAKPNTTRNQIQAIYDNEDYQIIFVDTPGINNINDTISSYLNKVAINGIKDADIITVIFSANNKISIEDKKTINILKNMHSQAIIIAVVSKIDLISKNELILKLEEVNSLFTWNEIIPLSSLKNNNVDKYLNLIKNNLKKGPKYYLPGGKSNFSEKFLIKEIIREKCFKLLNKELPYSIAIELTKIANDKNKLIIYGNIITEWTSQKAIIIGENGKMIKKIGTEARKELENSLKKKIFLELYVKVDEKWKYSQQSINKYLDPND